ncbi:hypothetical protein OUZ56_033173 [Daphnia magna]|uniref:Uncharacterized protein n=1 Tax=Daphnia magna TaxID=35525 RepID=A0ABR0BAD9_9CRUS|nr:hypothetical protein OUZ56_033173 [Daphnia magna]
MVTNGFLVLLGRARAAGWRQIEGGCLRHVEIVGVHHRDVPDLRRREGGHELGRTDDDHSKLLGGELPVLDSGRNLPTHRREVCELLVVHRLDAPRALQIRDFRRSKTFNFLKDCREGRRQLGTSHRRSEHDWRWEMFRTKGLVRTIGCPLLGPKVLKETGSGPPCERGAEQLQCGAIGVVKGHAGRKDRHRREQCRLRRAVVDEENFRRPLMPKIRGFRRRRRSGALPVAESLLEECQPLVLFNVAGHDQQRTGRGEQSASSRFEVIQRELTSRQIVGGPRTIRRKNSGDRVAGNRVWGDRRDQLVGMGTSLVPIQLRFGKAL